MDVIVGNQETIERLKVVAIDGNCPHIVSLLFDYRFNVTFLLGDGQYRVNDQYPLPGAPTPRQRMPGGSFETKRI